MKFDPGQIVATGGVSRTMDKNAEFRAFCETALRRHLECDWGDVDADDASMNNYAVEFSGRLLSAYKLPRLMQADTNYGSSTVEMIWIITEYDRSATTLLFPEEY